MDITIGNYTGINIDSDAIHFGTSKKSGEWTRLSPSITREVIVTNNSTNNKKVAIDLFGNISKFVSLSDNYFILPPGGNKTILVTAQIGQEADCGMYTGTLRALFK